MDDAATEEFLRLLAQHERVIVRYVHGLVSHHTDATEVMQETKVTMWKKYRDFERGTNFAAWGKKIALGLILNYRRTNKRRKTTPTEIAFIEAVAAEMDQLEAGDNRRSEALQNCLKKLPAPHRELILWRYYEDEEIAEIATKASRTEAAVYRMLSRIRKLLQECIETEAQMDTNF
jgi:RNA polymerase sigma-70 factor, ECF subfamily